MENINDNKFAKLSTSELKEIKGGFPSWNVIHNTVDACGGTLNQRFNWFGLHGTDDITHD